MGGDRGPLVETVRRALARAGIRSRRAILGLPRWQVTARISALPVADRAALQRVVESELADHIPFPMDQVVLDFQALGPSREHPGLSDVLVAAAQRELVQEYLVLAEELGLRLVAIAVDALALHDLVRLAAEAQTGLVIAVDVGTRAATINISEGDRLRLTRSVGLGGQQLTRAIQQDLGVGVEEAERLKQTEGLALLDRSPRPSHAAAWLDNLQGEIRRSALSCGPGQVSGLLLLGGGAATPGLRETLGAQFGVEPSRVSVSDVFPGAELRGDGPEAAEHALLAMGQALRSLGLSEWELSLLPAEVLAARRARRLRRAGVMAALFVLLALAGWYVSARSAIARQDVLVAQLRKDAKVADQRRAHAEKVSAERARLREQMQVLEAVRARRYAALEILRAMTLYVPKEIVLTHFALRPQQPLEIQGKAPSSAAAVELQRALGLSSLVSEVELVGTRQAFRRGETGQAVTFTMRARLRRQPAADGQGGTASLAPWEGAQ
jgi:type IV pilus assembly protein PilM